MPRECIFFRTFPNSHGDGLRFLGGKYRIFNANEAVILFSLSSWYFLFVNPALATTHSSQQPPVLSVQTQQYLKYFKARDSECRQGILVAATALLFHK
jgi:hypothetical protein